VRASLNSTYKELRPKGPEERKLKGAKVQNPKGARNKPKGARHKPKGASGYASPKEERIGPKGHSQAGSKELRLA
jgi:hypothetical protein